jgi:biopolymer transport protein ExbD
MSPLRLVIAGLSLVLLAVVLFWIVGNAVKAGPFTEFFYFEGLLFSQFFIGSVGGAGIFLILRGIWLWERKGLPPGSLPRIFPEIKLRNLTVWKGRTFSPSLVASTLNAFSVSWICVLMTLVTIFMVFRPRPPMGLFIDWKERSHVLATESPWRETMSVYIARPGQFYVNGIPTKRQELESRLRAELGRRAVWTIYLEADDDTMFIDTVYAIDAIQGLGAKVVWITPKTREEWKKQQR